MRDTYTTTRQADREGRGDANYLRYLASQNKIPRAVKVANVWLIPKGFTVRKMQKKTEQG